jgi:uncharacterized membrane protein YdbT with pleckstrin-like domain
MAQRSFIPNARYQIKLLVVNTVIAFLILVGTGVLSALIGLDDPSAALTIFLIFTGLDAVYWLVAIAVILPYYRSLRYEIHEDEVIVHVGIFTHSVKHVPYRTVTNITVSRDIFDRWFFNLGTLQIQTAGMSGQSGAEEKLVGLENVQEVYEMVVTELRRFRGGMSPTAAEEEPEEIAKVTTEDLLEEVRAIRRLLESERS